MDISICFIIDQFAWIYILHIYIYIYLDIEKLTSTSKAKHIIRVVHFVPSSPSALASFT